MNSMELHESNVIFDEESHRYTLGRKELKGITSTLIPAVFGDYTETIPEAVLEKAAERGTLIHKNIELLDELNVPPTFREVEEYLRIRNELGLSPVASEYIVTDGRYFASPIDKVFEGDIIADIKTTSELHYERVCFQLSWYATYYQKANGRGVSKAYAIWLPREQYGECRAVEVSLVAPHVVRKIVSDYIRGEDVTKYASQFALRLPARASSVIEKIRHKQAIAEKYSRECEEMKKTLIDAFTLMGVKKFENEDISITRVAPSERTTLDTKAVQARYPSVWEECKRTSVTKESIRITIKNK